MLQAIVDLSQFTPIWNFYEAQMPVAIKRIAEDIAKEAETEMERRAPVAAIGGGRLKKSIRSIPVSISAREAVYSVGPDVPYLPYVVSGTRPHTIYPRVAQALRWIDAETGEVRFAKYVHHPGTRPNPFIRQTSDVVHSRAFGIAMRVIRSMIG